MSGRIARIVVALVISAAAGTSSAAVLGPHFDAVRQYDENVVQANQVDVSAFALTVATMTSNVATAFDNGRGGVVNFDNGSFTNPMTIDAGFAGGNKVLRLNSGIRNWSIGVLGTGGGGAISGPNVSFNGAPSPFPTPYNNQLIVGDVTDTNTNVVLPDERVTSFGFTIIDTTFNGAGINLHFDAFFSNGSTQSNNFFMPLGGNGLDTFFGWTAPAGAYLTQLNWTADNNLASDDWAFITSVVPEPASGALCTALSFVTIARRKR